MNLAHIPRPLTLIIAVVSGFLTDWAFPDRNMWALAFVGIAGLWIATSRDAPGWNVLVGSAWGIAFFLPHVQWAQYAVGGNLPWIALSIFEGLYIGLFAWAWSMARRSRVLARRPLGQVLAFAALWIAVEYVRMVFPFGGFPWGRLGFSQSDSPLARLAWLGGVPLLSFTVALAGALLAVFIRAMLRMNLVAMGASALACSLLVVVGWLVPLDTQAQQGNLLVGAVQGNVSEPGLGAFANRQEVLNNHVNGTLALEDSGVDVVVWPENGTDIDPQVDAGAARLIDDAAQAVKAPLLLGAQEYPDSGGRYNVSLVWEAGQGVTDRYAKQHPVPFGEYIPYREFFRSLSPAVDMISTDMLPGNKSAVVDIPISRLERDVTLSPIICFEVGYDDLIYDAVKNGGEALVVQTNNASFGPTNESTQQLAMSRIRAIETGRAVVHISTVGVSAVYTPNGVERERTGHFTAEQFTQQIALRDSLTPAVWLGVYPTWVAVGVSAILIAAGIMNRQVKPRGVRPSAPRASRPRKA
ncbi:apolipoprotein N-acyltransferase [Jonesia quinghaiensis]|uniref:apolipoprotein N-acyltransferase n=1 Tax=Jonesia quinghaiensis TaxID=262806 RepID=UPI001FE17503|nr:apolipoprotein N-acyltransferase [Jonesia quinghaiensis]